MTAVFYKARRRCVVTTLRDAPERVAGRLVADEPGQMRAIGASLQHLDNDRPRTLYGSSGRPSPSLENRLRRSLRAGLGPAGPGTCWRGPGGAGAGLPSSSGRTAPAARPGGGAGRRRGARRAGFGPRPVLMGLFIVAVLCGLFGCASTMPADALRLSPETLEQRQQQTRRFDETSETEILAASAGVLQDLGFNLDESETELGVLVASKRRSAKDGRQIATALLLDIFIGWEMETDQKQRIRASLVTRPAPAGSGGVGESFFVRITFQRVVWDSANEVSRSERLAEPELYQGFFERLSKSVFLEAHKI